MPTITNFSAENIPLDEIEAFYSLDGIAPPPGRPYTWCMSVATLDGITSMLEPGQVDGQSIALAHIPDSGNGADWRLLNAGWMYADAVLGTGQIVRVEPQTKWLPLFDDLAAYRRDTLKKPANPLNVVLTGTGNIDLRHPIFNDPAFTTLILTTAAGRDRALRSADNAAAQNLHPLTEGDTRIDVLGHGEQLDYHEIVRHLYDQYQVRHLDITAGGAVIAALARLKLIDECRITYAGSYSGPFNSQGERRPGLFDLPPGQSYTPADNPLVHYTHLVAWGHHHLFIRGRLQYRH